MTRIAYLRQLLFRQRYLLLGPAFLLVPLGVAVAVLRPDVWQARLALVLRDEAIGDLGWRPIGRFDSMEQLKAAQEIILQFAKQRPVVEAALAQVGPPEGTRPASWPNGKAVEELQEHISVGAPKGAELGKTELLYLAVKAPTAERAVQLTSALADQLDRHLQSLRSARAESIVRELGQKVALSDKDLAASTARLKEMEAAMGADLGELRTLTASVSGESNLRTSLSDVRSEIRRVSAERSQLEKQMEILRAAARDPQALAAAPAALLETRPLIRRLKEGLAEAQLHTATLLGKMQPEHPQVRAARQAEREVRAQLQGELELAVEATEAELEINAALLATFQRQLDSTSERLARLAEVRANYANLVREVEDRSQQLSQAREAYDNALAAHRAAQTGSLLTRIDRPDPGIRPIGPGPWAVAAGALAGSILLGVGLVLLVTPLDQLRPIVTGCLAGNPGEPIKASTGAQAQRLTAGVGGR